MVGRTFEIAGELRVRRLGYGTAQLTGPGYWGPRLTSGEAVALLRLAVDRGVTLIDTADNYGPDIAEELIAQALHPYPGDLVVATKGGVIRTGPDEWHPAGRPEDLRAMCEASLRRLRTDAIDLYQLHRIDPAVPLADQLGTLAELREEGKIRHIGLDTVTLDQLDEALTVLRPASVQNRFNVLDRESEPVLGRCEELGIAFLPWFPLGNGSLAASASASARARAGAGSGSEAGAGAAIERVAARHGATSGQVALAWLLHRSPVVLPTPGTGSAVHLEENLAAADLVLTDEDTRTLDALTS
ncbi:aldo/keto reductase [Nonomuraea sp. NPDC049684]|uniref:aldo/keto reductase n=1 Tax=Nonomuraea sp. NPDC049684 TaxID=3364356 RepID=UPI0037B9777E